MDYLLPSILFGFLVIAITAFIYYLFNGEIGS